MWMCNVSHQQSHGSLLRYVPDTTEQPDSLQVRLSPHRVLGHLRTETPNGSSEDCLFPVTQFLNVQVSLFSLLCF